MSCDPYGERYCSCELTLVPLKVLRLSYNSFQVKHIIRFARAFHGAGHTPQHMDCSPDTMALIASDCDALRCAPRASNGPKSPRIVRPPENTFLTELDLSWNSVGDDGEPPRPYSCSPHGTPLPQL